MKIFYIYRWIRNDTNTPFYIGKGKANRFKQLYGRNKYFKNILKVTTCRVEIILNCLTEEQAFIKEIEFIKLYKSFGYCEANLVMGGEGISGFSHSEETRQKMSEWQIGRKMSKEAKIKMSQAKKGRKPSQETRAKMSNSNKGKNTGSKNGMYGRNGETHPMYGKVGKESVRSKKTLCVNTGAIFESARQAALALNLHRSHVVSICLGKRKKTKGFVFRYLNIDNKID